MSTLADLNTYSSTSVNFDTTDLDISIDTGVAFNVPYITYDLAKTIGSSATAGALIDITHPDCTVAFPNIANATNTLTVTVVSPTNTTISGMKTFQDWTSSFCVATCSAASTTITNVFKDVGATADFTLVVNAT